MRISDWSSDVCSSDLLDDAKRFAETVRKEYPDQMLAYNCSPSFNWEANIDKATIAKFQKEIAAMGYKYQFVTLAGFHQLNHGKIGRASCRDRVCQYV